MTTENFVNNVDSQYLALLRDILDNGETKPDRTGTGTKSVFGRQLRFSLSENFPLLTTKRIHAKSVIYELLWFIRGDTNTKFLKDHGITIWDEWTDENGEVGWTYGKQWRSWEAPDGRKIDQLQNAIDTIRKNPNSRRIIVSAWNPADIEKTILPPCHIMYQFAVSGNRLSCSMYQRSVDTFLGLPFNIASYALLTYMIAHTTNLQPHELIISTGDTHLYLNHLDQARLQLTREPLPLPRLKITRDNIKEVDDFKYEDIKIEQYHPHPAIAAKISP